MPDRETVVKGLECCVRTIEDCECADNCPYETQCYVGTMYLDLMRDALALLTPRVLSLDEIHRGMAVWLEDRDKPDLLLAIGGSSCAGAKCFIGENDKSIAANDDEYNIRWRAWTSEPTDEQRKAAKWYDT